MRLMTTCTAMAQNRAACTWDTSLESAHNCPRCKEPHGNMASMPDSCGAPHALLLHSHTLKSKSLTQVLLLHSHMRCYCTATP